MFAFILHNVDIILQYHDNKDLERLVVVLMAILDRQEKLQLLKDIRSTVDTHHQPWLQNITLPFPLDACFIRQNVLWSERGFSPSIFDQSAMRIVAIIFVSLLLLRLLFITCLASCLKKILTDSILFLFFDVFFFYFPS